VTHYNQEACSTAWAHLQARVIRSHDPNSKRVAGTVQCRYCLARATCPQAIEWVKNCSQITSPNPVEKIVKHLTPEQCLEVWDKRNTLYAILDGIEFRLKMLTDKQLKELGLEHKEGPMRETITNPEVLFSRLQSLKVTSKEFTSIVKVPKSGVQDLVRAATQLKGKELEKAVKELLDGLTESKQTKSSLVRVKE
jgi:hypothetical protein